MLPLFFARRYLFSPKSRSVINLIAALSVAAVAIPVAAMILLLSVINGFEGLIRQSNALFDADLRIVPREGSTFRLADLDTAALARLDRVEAVSAILEERILIEANGRRVTATLRGADDRYTDVLPFAGAVTGGEAVLRLGDLDRLVVGRALAQQLGIRSHVDAALRLYAVRRNSFSPLLPLDNYTLRTLPVGGIFEADYNTETACVVAPLRAAERLLDHEGRASALLLRCAAPGSVERLRSAVADAVGDRFRVETREEVSASVYRLVRYEKWGVFFIALMVLVDAAFSIVGALSMLILEKRADCATLGALGAPDRLIRAIFRREGELICALGCGCGVVLGMGLTLAQQRFGLVEIPADSFLAKSYPIEFRLTDLLAVVAVFIPVARGLTALTVRNLLKNVPQA